jgi:hypothetical protein
LANVVAEHQQTDTPVSSQGSAAGSSQASSGGASSAAASQDPQPMVVDSDDDDNDGTCAEDASRAGDPKKQSIKSTAVILGKLIHFNRKNFNQCSVK